MEMSLFHIEMANPFIPIESCIDLDQVKVDGEFSIVPIAARDLTLGFGLLIGGTEVRVVNLPLLNRASNINPVNQLWKLPKLLPIQMAQSLMPAGSRCGIS